MQLISFCIACNRGNQTLKERTRILLRNYQNYALILSPSFQMHEQSQGLRTQRVKNQRWQVVTLLQNHQTVQRSTNRRKSARNRKSKVGRKNIYKFSQNYIKFNWPQRNWYVQAIEAEGILQNAQRFCNIWEITGQGWRWNLGESSRALEDWCRVSSNSRFEIRKERELLGS